MILGAAFEYAHHVLILRDEKFGRSVSRYLEELEQHLGIDLRKVEGLPPRHDLTLLGWKSHLHLDGLFQLETDVPETRRAKCYTKRAG
jgi:hypothetical protein